MTTPAEYRALAARVMALNTLIARAQELRDAAAKEIKE